jgi:hypothetical protein
VYPTPDHNGPRYSAFNGTALSRLLDLEGDDKPAMLALKALETQISA